MKILVAFCVLVAGASAQVGPSGIVNPNGVNQQFSHAYADDIVIIGPSGIVTKSGDNLQLTGEQAALHNRRKRQVGASGIVNPNGVNQQFSHAFADDIVIIGPAGIVTKSGANLQLTAEQAALHNRRKRSASETNPKVYGEAGIVTGYQNIQLFPGEHVVVSSDSGAVLNTGRNVQYRQKRDAELLKGPAGVLFKDGQKRHLPPGVTKVLETESGIVYSDGQNIQF